MRVSAAKTAQRVERNVYLKYLNIKSYGDGNDYPQKVLDIVASSGTGKTCFDIYVKFVEGAGFRDQALVDAVINDRGERASALLTKFAKDLKYFNGFACLVKYDFSGRAFAFYDVPFEHCRLEIDQEGNYTGRVAVHPDWAKQTGMTFKKSDVKFFHRFDPESVLDEILEVGTPAEYLGQIYYFTWDGDWEYPICPFDPIVTDMLTEESISTVKHRNAKFNFLPAGILIRKGIKPRTTDDGNIDPSDPYNQEQEASAIEFRRMQGDSNASKIWVVDVDADEEKPEFIEFEAKNYDKQFEYSETTVQDNIGRMFKVPPILRGVDIGAGFGADLMVNAYNYMNSVVDDERRKIETVFMDLFQVWPQQYDYTIDPIKYVANESIGNEG